MLPNHIQIPGQPGHYKGEHLTTNLGQINHNQSLTSNRFKIVKTKSVRVGGGYFLSRYERKIPENPANVKFLKAAIRLRMNCQKELLQRLDELLSQNENLTELVTNGKLDKECYQSTQLAKQRKELQIHKMELEAAELEENLSEIKEKLQVTKENGPKIVEEMAENVEKVTKDLQKTIIRAHQLNHFDDISKPLLYVKMQELTDEISKLKSLTNDEILRKRELYDNQISNYSNIYQNNKNEILSKTIDLSLKSYPKRLIREFYLNTRMKNEKIKFENEIELLKKEIQELEGKIEEIPKSSFEDRTKTEALNFPIQVDSQADICFDFERKIRLPL